MYLKNFKKQEKSEDNQVTQNASPSSSTISQIPLRVGPMVQNFPVNTLKRKFPDDESVVFLDDMILQPLKNRLEFIKNWI